MKYNPDKLDSIAKLLTSILIYIIFFVTVMLVYHNSIPAPYCLLGIPVILISYHFIQAYCYQAVVYTLLHVAFLLPIYLLPFPYQEYRYLYYIMLGFEIVQALRSQHQNANGNFVWNLLVVGGSIYMCVFGANQSGLVKLIYYLGIIVIIIYFVRFFLSGLIKLLSTATQVTSIPVKTIIINNSYLFVVFVVIFILFAVAMQTSSFGSFLEKIMKLVSLLLFYLLTIIISSRSSENQPLEQQKVERSIEKVVDDLSTPPIYEQIVECLFIIACIILAAYGIYMLIKWLMQVFTKRYSHDMDTVIELDKPIDITKELKDKGSVVEQVKEFFKGDNISKIRRSYRLKIKSYKSLNCQECDTPAELAKRIDNDYKENIDELTNVYEKARYSNEEITFADVQKAR